MGLNVLLIGSGGREHALAWKLSQSPRLRKLYVAPGNGGTQSITENVSTQPKAIEALIRFAKQNSIDLTIVGPEDPLSMGVVNQFQNHGLRIFGPTDDAAVIETSKAFAKELMAQANIPTPAFKVFNNFTDARQYIDQHGTTVVVKASGLAQGKGAYLCNNAGEAYQALHEILEEKVFGPTAGSKVIIEDFLSGQEISIHAFCDGKTFKLMPTAQDHKQVFDGDTGPNTGGMGTIAPVPWVTNELLDQIKKTIVQPALERLSQFGHPFVGCLYPGLMITDQGPMVLEFNARFGDPETQVFMRLLKTDLLDIIEACVDGRLADTPIEWDDGYAVCIVLASGGYPGKYKKGLPIHGLDEAERITGVTIFHAGTTYENGQLVTSGGRVLGVTATGATLQSAVDLAHEAVRYIRFDGMHYRKDIGTKALSTI